MGKKPYCRVKIPAKKIMEKLMGRMEDALTKGLLQLQEAQLDRMNALDY